MCKLLQINYPKVLMIDVFFAVNFEHKGYVESEKFKYFVSPKKVKKALLWLKRNNLLYEHIAISEENEELLTDTEMDFKILIWKVLPLHQ